MKKSVLPALVISIPISSAAQNRVNIFRYSIAELFLLMVYAAIATWIFQFHWAAGLLCLGTFMGIEAGRKTKYTVWLMIPAGLMMAASFVFAISSTFEVGFGLGDQANLALGFTRNPGKYGQLYYGAQLLLWAFAFSSLIWFLYAWSTVKESAESQEATARRRRELEKLVKEKREALKQNPTS